MSLDEKERCRVYEEKCRLYYETLHDFRTSENRAFEQRTQLFLATNSILAVAFAYSSEPQNPLRIALPVLGLAVSLVAIIVGLRIKVSLDVLQQKLEKCEKRIWRSTESAEVGPYTYWRANRERGWVWARRKENCQWVKWKWRVFRWPLACPTRVMVSVLPMVLFVLLWILMLLWKTGLFG
jgi:hypothetical protein